MVATEAGPVVMSQSPASQLLLFVFPAGVGWLCHLVTFPAECHFEPVVLAEPIAAFGTCGRVMMGKQRDDAFLKAQGERSWDAG